jgi:hypothetical protein
MSTTTNNYFLNVNTYFRDIDKYPNPCDFGINFSRFNGTGTFVQGSPLNPESFFEQASIDPDFKDDDLKIINSSIDNIYRNDTEVIICGLFDFTRDFVIKYQNNLLYFKTGTSFAGFNSGPSSGAYVWNQVSMKVPYLIKFSYDIDAIIPYSVSWLIFTKPNPIPNIFFNKSTKSTFRVTNTNNIYFMFDFSMRYFNFIIEKNYNELVITSAANPTINPKLLDDALGNYGNICVCLTYIDKDGDVGITNGHAYGYHIFSNTYDLIGSESNGKLSLEVDSSENAYICLNTNSTTTTVSKVSNTVNTWRQGYFFMLTNVNNNSYNFWDNQTGTFTIHTNQLAYNPFIVSISTGPYAVFFTLDDPNSPYLQTSIVYPETGYTTDNQLVLSSIPFTGTNSDLFLWISYSKGNLIATATGSKIYYVDKNNGFGMTGVGWIPSTGGASLCHCYYGGTTYLLSKNLTNYVDLYTFNTTTYSLTRITGIQVPSTYNFLFSIGYTINGTDIYFFMIPLLPGLTLSSYWYLAGQTAYVLKYDTITTILTVHNTIPNLGYLYTQGIDISIRDTSNYLIVQSTPQSNIQIYDVTNPSNIILKTTLPYANWGTFLSYEHIYKGQKKYYLDVNYLKSIGRTYDITNIDNIFEIGNNNYPYEYWRQCRTIGIHNDYIWCRLTVLFGTIVDQPAAFVKMKIPYLDQNFSSIQFNQNLAKTVESPSGARCCCTFNYNNKAYLAIASQNYLSIYDITSIRAEFLVSQILISLPNTVNDIKTITFNNLNYFLITGLNYVYSFILSPTFDSISLASYYTDPTNNFPEGNLFIFNNNLYAITTASSSSLLLKFKFSPTLTLTGSAIIQIGRIPVLVGNYYDSKLGIQVCQVCQTINFSSTSDPYRYFDISSSDNPLFLGLSGSLPCLIPRSGVFFTDPRDGITYSTFVVPIGAGIFSFENFNPALGIFPAVVTVDYSSPNISRGLNTKARMFYTDRPYMVNNVYGKIGSEGDYLKCFDLTKIDANSKQIFNNILVAGTGATSLTPIYNVDMNISQINNKTTLVLLNSDNNFYLYDMSNPYFSAKYQQRGIISNNYISSYSIGNSIIVKLDNEGNEYYKTFLKNTQNGTGPTGQLVNVSNLKISNDNLNFYVCGGYKDQIQSYNFTGALFNQLQSYGRGYDGFIAKCDAINGNWVWILPIYGESDDFMQKIQYTESNKIILCGYTKSQNMLVYQKQTAVSTITPIVYQSNIVGSTNNSNGFIMVFSSDGVLLWSSNIYSDDPQTIVNILDIGYENSQIVATGLTNSKTVKCIDSSKTNVQNLNTENTTNLDNTLLNYYFDINGNYLKSQYIHLPTNAQARINDIKINSSINNITLAPTITYNLDTNIEYYNKDGTLALSSTGVSNNIVSYIVNYIYDSRFTDSNGNKYSTIKLKNTPNYSFTGGFMTNYNMYILGNNDGILNKNFSIRDNYESPTGDYRIVLNSSIDTSKINRDLFYVNNITGSNNYYNINISPTPLVYIFEYNINDMPTINNTITTINAQSINTSNTYYIIFPKNNSVQYIPVLKTTIDSNGDYVFQLNDVNDLRISTGGSFYGPYLYLTQFNQNIFYNLQFYPSSLNTPVYYSIQLNSLVLPNRPLRQNPEKYIKNLTDMPYIYVAIYSVDDEDLADQEIVNIVYDNNPNREKIEIFQLNTVNAGDTSNYVTYTSSTVPKVKFNSTFTTLRIKIFDPYGKILLFDNTPYKAIDSRFTGNVVPLELMNISIQFTLLKKF